MDSPEVQEGSVETNLLFHFSDLYCDHLVLSERNLGGCIGFGDSAHQAGEKPKHCGCAGLRPGREQTNIAKYVPIRAERQDNRVTN